MRFVRGSILISLAFAILLVSYRGAEAKDEWVQVRSRNFLLIGNASEKDIRRVGTRLEQFRETFRLLFANMNLTSSIPTNVIVFKNNSSYKNFKPKRADGRIDNEIAGFFQPGEDVNYITLSAEGEEGQTFSTIFHEYVHFIVNTNFGKSEVPAWFNEGLAEYYETFVIEADQKVKLGLLQNRHLPLLQQNKLIPLGSLFNTSNYQLLQTGGHSRSMFYAESWALVHYLIQSGKSDGLGKFLTALLRDVPAEKAFQDAFQTNYAQMENDLDRYVRQNRYQYHEFTFKNKLIFDSDMRTLPLDDAASNAYLGDLLYHTNRAADAEPYLLAALKLQPDSSMANTTLGMVRLKQRKFNEAKASLEKAIAGDQKNHIAFFRYAFLLSREAHDEFGYVHRFEPDVAAKMRSSLRKAIAISPMFTESYELLAFVDIVNNEELDDAVKLMQTALKYQPGNQRYSLRIAEIYSHQNRLLEAGQLAERIAKTSDEPDVKSRADDLVRLIIQRKEMEEKNAEERRQYEAARASFEKGASLPERRIEGVKKPSDADLEKAKADAGLRSMNAALRVPAQGEQRVLGNIQKIDCKKRPLIFTVKTLSESFAVTSADFTSLSLNTFDAKMANVDVGCDANISAFNALVTYHPSAAKPPYRGELVAIEFVPAGFRIMTDEEMRAGTLVIYDQPDTPVKNSPDVFTIPLIDADLATQRRTMMMQAIRGALRKPTDGQKQEIGFLEGIDCTAKGVFLILRTDTRVLRLVNSSIQKLAIRYFTPDLSEAQFGCGIRPIEFPAVFIYSEKPDAKAKTSGEIISLDFVPKSFILEPK